MTPDIVVDIGNSRMKWGWCENGRVERVSILGDDVADWDYVIREQTNGDIRWAIASVHVARLEKFLNWVDSRSDRRIIIENREQIPIPLCIESPDSVGLDRLCASLAAVSLHGPGPLLVIQAGTAVVLNLVNFNGEFRGGAILPGFHLMSRALATGTSRLPAVEFAEPEWILPGENTQDAIKRGIYWSINGAVIMFRTAFGLTEDTDELKVVLTGGDANLLLTEIKPPIIHVPALTLEGIRIAAEALP
jgi:type III pantothenate kinase